MKNLIKNTYLKHKEISHNFFWRSLQIFGKQGITFLIFVLCAKLLGVYEFGVYNYLVVAVFILVMLGDFGISTATSKYVAEYNAIDKNKLKLVLFNSGIIILGITFLITIGTLLLGSWYFKEKYIYILYLLPLIFLVPITSLYDGVYRGLKKFKQLAISYLSVGFLSVFVIYFIIKSFGLTGALISQNIFYFFILLVLSFGYKEFSFKFNKEIIKEIGTYSFVYGLATIGYYLFAKTDLIILGHFGYFKEIATYEILNKIFWILLFPFTILGQVVAPNFSKFWAEKEYKKVFDKLKKYSLLFVFISIAYSSVLYFVIPQVVKIFFLEYYNPLLFIIFPFTLTIFFIHACTSTIDHGIIVPTGFAFLMSKIYLVLGFLNVIFSIVLVRTIGFIGPILATVVASFLMLVLLRGLYFYKVRNKIKLKF